MKKKLIIVGDSAFAEIAYEYFTYDSDYEVVAFSVESQYITKNELMGLPVLAFEEIQDFFEPHDYFVYVAIVYTSLNRLRTRLADEAKNKGFKLASYISSNSFVWKNVDVGDHCFIFENNTVQPFSKIGENVVLWSGNHIGHHSIINNNCFISSQVVISGFCEIGKNTFMGVNSTVGNNISIGGDNWIGQAVNITKDTGNDVLIKGEASIKAKVSATRFFRVKT